MSTILSWASVIGIKGFFHLASYKQLLALLMNLGVLENTKFQQRIGSNWINYWLLIPPLNKTNALRQVCSVALIFSPWIREMISWNTWSWEVMWAWSVLDTGPQDDRRDAGKWQNTWGTNLNWLLELLCSCGSHLNSNQQAQKARILVTLQTCNWGRHWWPSS